jgi:hypothetical protein
LLPEFPALKERFHQAVTRYLRDRARAHGVIVPDVPRSRIFEGRGHAIVRPSGETEVTQMFEAAAEMRIPIEDIPNLALDALLAKLDDIAESLASQQEKHLLQTIDAGLEKSGQTIDGKGKPFSPELVFLALEKIELDFNADGTARMPTVFVHPDQIPAVRAASATFDADPALKKRFDDIIAKKREEWRAREADRRLVG